MATMDNIETQLPGILNKYHLVPPGSRVLVAVSGGADSVCLLHALLAAAQAGTPFDLEVAHLDHGLRQESADDAQFVIHLCNRLGLPCHVMRVDVHALARQRGLGIEEAGRAARRKFLQQIAQETHCVRIALAHHLDDQAETVLLRLTRGCGVSGLAAMHWRDGVFIRPFLATGRQQIIRYLQDRAIEYVEDVSNSSMVYARNRVRHQVLPQLVQINPAVSTQLAKLAHIAALEEDYWQQQIDAVVQRVATRRGYELRLCCRALLMEHPALYVRVLRSCLEQVRGSLCGIEMVHIEAIAALLQEGRPQRELSLPQVWVARRYDELVFCARAPEPGAKFALVVTAPGSYPLPDGSMLQIKLSPPCGVESSRYVEFDANVVEFPLCVRFVQAGDRITSAGMAGRKKIKKIFAEQRMELEQRRSALVLTQDQKLLWLLGLRRCGEYGVLPGDSAALCCEIIPAQ